MKLAIGTALFLASAMAFAAPTQEQHDLDAIDACSVRCTDIATDAFHLVEAKLEEIATFKEMVITKSAEWNQRLSTVKGVFRDRATDRALSACRTARAGAIDMYQCEIGCLADIEDYKAAYSDSPWPSMGSRYGIQKKTLVLLAAAIGAWPTPDSGYHYRTYLGFRSTVFPAHEIPIHSATWRACRANLGLDY